MLRRIYHALPLPQRVRVIISKAYYRGYFFANLRTYINYIRSRIICYKNKKALKRLRNIINLAKERNKPIFVQFPVIPWEARLFQRPQQIALAMNKLNYLTIYISPNPIKFGLKEIREDLYVTDQHIILKDLTNAIISIYLNYPSLLYDTYLTKEFYENNVVFYEYVDHIDDAIWGKKLAGIMYQRLQNLAKINFRYIVTTSKVLYQNLLTTLPKSKILYNPNGVDVEHYKNVAEEPNIRKVNKYLLKAVEQKKKIIGYFGAIAPWIWDELILNLADNRPNYYILMIGPLYGDRDLLPHRPNIIYTGAVEYNDLPFYAKFFDVSIIPFRMGEIAKTTSPLKLFEYFSIGKPIVVTSDLIECTKFEGVLSAGTKEEFALKVDEALDSNSLTEIKEKYSIYAQANSWENRARELIKELNYENKLFV